MDFVGLHAPTHGGVDLLVALDQALALECSRHHGRVPVATVARQFTVFAGQTCKDEGADLVGSLGGSCNEILASDLVAGAQKMDGNCADDQQGAAHHTDAQPGRDIALAEEAEAETVDHVEKRIEVAHALPERGQ